MRERERERERGLEEGALEIPRNVHAHALGILKFHRIPKNINAGAAWNLGLSNPNSKTRNYLHNQEFHNLELLT
jgi:hypothetical protein